MFQLYDRTRRRIALALFGLVVAVPTVLVLAWAVWLHLPGHLEAAAAQLSQQLGVKVSLLACRPQTPTWTIYEGVQLLDAENERPILYCARLDVQWQPAQLDAQGNPQPTLLLRGSEIAYDAAQEEQAWQALERLLARRTGWGDFDVQVSTPQLTVRNAQGSHALPTLQLRLQSNASQSRAEGSFQWSTDAAEPIRFCLLRDRKSEPPETGFGLDTGNTSLPCHLLPNALRLTELLGPQSTLQGSFFAKSTGQGWSGGLWKPNLQLVLDHVDFQRLVSQHFPHAWQGTGQLKLFGLQFSHNRLQELNGWLSSQQGDISSSLLESCVQRFGLRCPAETLLQQSHLPYDKLVLGFQVTPQGIRVCGEQPSQVILRGAGGPILMQGDLQPKRIESLVQALVPEGHVEVPTSAQANWLLQHLPLPATPATGDRTARVR